MEREIPVAVQRLTSLQRAGITRPLLGLPVDDRRLRFGHCVCDAALGNSVAGIDFSRDGVFGVQATDLTPLGVAHLALKDPFALVDQLLRQQYSWLALPRAAKLQP